MFCQNNPLSKIVIKNSKIKSKISGLDQDCGKH